MSELLQDAVNALQNIAESLRRLADAHTNNVKAYDASATVDANPLQLHSEYEIGYRQALDDYGLHSVRSRESVDDVDKAGG
jgi:hypothetical protein